MLEFSRRCNVTSTRPLFPLQLHRLLNRESFRAPAFPEQAVSSRLTPALPVILPCHTMNGRWEAMAEMTSVGIVPALRH